MSETKRMSDESLEALTDGAADGSQRHLERLAAEARRSRAREKRLEGRLREMVDALRQGHTIYPGSYLATAARAALSEET